MASRRNLKKNINNLTFDLVSECFTYRYFHPQKKHDKTNKAMENIVKKRNELIEKVNNPSAKDDYKKNRDYYRTLQKEMRKMVSLLDNL